MIRAAYYGFVEAVRFLVLYGADIHAVNDRGETALNVASSRGHRVVANLLRQAAADHDLKMSGTTCPPPRYPTGTSVRTRTGTPREGWIVLYEWHHKHAGYAYHIEVAGKTQARKTVSQRYWEEDLEAIEIA